MTKPFKTMLATVGTVVVATSIIQIMIGILQERYVHSIDDFKQLIIVSSVAFAFVCILAVIYAYSIKHHKEGVIVGLLEGNLKQSRGELAKIEQSINQFIDRTKEELELLGSPWYYTKEKLITEEFVIYPKSTSPSRKKIRVVSRYLEHDDPNAYLAEYISSNVLNHNVEYEYIIPWIDFKQIQRYDDQNEWYAFRQRACHIYKTFTVAYDKPCPITLIPIEYFDYPCDLLIFNPDIREGRTSVFMELRVNVEPRDITQLGKPVGAEERVWARIDNSTAGNIAWNVEKDRKNHEIKDQGIINEYLLLGQ